MPKERILIADDEPVVRNVCVRAIQEDGYEIRAVASGAEAVEAAREQPFDLLLTDLRMPGMSGLEAYRAIQKLQPEIIGVAMTGYATMEAAIQALQLGFHDFILKPFTAEDVRRAVVRALEQRRLREENMRLRTLIPLYQLTQALVTITSVDELLDRIMQLTVQEAHVDTVAMLLLDRLGREVTVRSALGLLSAAQGAKLQATDPSPISRILNAKGPLVESADQSIGIPLPPGIGGAVSVPLIAQGQALGIMLVGRRAPATPFSQADVELLSVLAGQAAIAIKNAQLFEEIQTAYRKVEESEYLKSEFIAIASHELRTPLVSILGYAEILADELKGEARSQLGVILEQALRLRDIVNDMLSLSDLQAGTVELMPGPVTLEAALKTAVEALSSQIEAKAIRLFTTIAPDCTTIQADRDRLVLALSKLLDNAVKYSPRGGKVQFSAVRDRDEVIISISDEGPGIPRETQEKLFRPFYQVQESLRRPHGGMGLGLAIAKGMVDLHGGRIWVTSEPGKGSTFSFSIPQPR